VGATGLELLLPLTLKWGKERGLSLGETLEPVTTKPAQILGIAAGTLQEGTLADICVFDPNAEWKVEASSIVSQGKNTPFLGYNLQGRVQLTLVGGQVIFDRSSKSNKNAQ
jgi:dihydroorotase